jgi:hypothetical protein
VRVLVYTVTDFNDESHKCIDILAANMTLPDGVDFCVISNKPSPEGFKHKVILDPRYYVYGGFLKYSKLIPKGYDYYLFLDPDIVCFGNPMNLIDPNKEFTTICEPKESMGGPWFNYRRAPVSDRLKFFMLKGMNAGTFGFKHIKFTGSIRKLFEPHIQHNLIEDAKLEQTSYNYGMCLATDFDLSKSYDISDKSQLFAGYSPFDLSKQLFHFCGFQKTMADKYGEMASLVKARADTFNKIESC